MIDTINASCVNEYIYMIRGQQVMLDFDLANMYGYEVGQFNRQVKRNIERFPEDFMFQLTNQETDNVLKCQNGISKKKGGRRYNPYVFTEQGIYMLASVLRGETAVQQNIMIIRTFKEMRHCINQNQLLFNQVDILDLFYSIKKHEKDIDELKGCLFNQKELNKIMNNFLGEDKMKEFVILEGQKFEADEAYIKIYGQAKQSIYVVDNYINIHTLSHLKCKNKDVEVVIFSDNLGLGKGKLRQKEVTDFNREYPTLMVKNNSISHDRYIVIDYHTENEMIYHCGTSSKDAGRKLCGINRLADTQLLHSSIDSLLTHKNLVL
ncbi:MAG: ORF6N domain-containing protein [Coprobacillus sp.]